MVDCCHGKAGEELLSRLDFIAVIVIFFSYVTDGAGGVCL